jgi:Mn2+/Fe2+ NRAMP family transporter
MAEKPEKSSFGPGFLVTAAFIGPGTVTTCTLAGAGFGCALIYALVFATITTFILQEMTGRLSLGSGMDLGQALRAFPQSLFTRAVFIVLTLSAITFGCAAYEAGNIMGGALGLAMVTPLSQKIWAVIISLAAALILGLKKYVYIEKILMALVFLMSLSFLATLVLIRPDILSVLKGLVPAVPEGSLVLLLALVGTTVVPYNLFLHAAAVREKWRGQARLGGMRKDLALSIGLGGMISAAIVVTSAAAYYDKGLAVEEGVHMAEQLRPLFGPLAQILFGLGFFAAGMTSAVTAPYAAAFASSGILGWDGDRQAGGFHAVWLAVIVTGLAVSLSGFKPLSVILFAQVANGLILPVAAVFLLLVLNQRKKMGALTNTRMQNVLGGGVILIVSALGIWHIVRVFFR